MHSTNTRAKRDEDDDTRTAFDGRLTAPPRSRDEVQAFVLKYWPGATPSSVQAPIA